jgi:hypothetical protein
MVYSPRFARELSRVASARVDQKIYDTLDIIEAVPSIGSEYSPDDPSRVWGRCP